jgi:hypothetical protein
VRAVVAAVVEVDLVAVVAALAGADWPSPQKLLVQSRLQLAVSALSAPSSHSSPALVAVAADVEQAVAVAALAGAVQVAVVALLAGVEHAVAAHRVEEWPLELA